MNRNESSQHQSNNQTLSELNEVYTDFENDLRKLFQQGRSINSQHFAQFYFKVSKFCNHQLRFKKKATNESILMSGVQLTGSVLYERIECFLKVYLSELCNRFTAVNGENVLFLENYVEQYNIYKNFCANLGVICRNLEKYFVKNQDKKGIYKINRLALITWKEQWFTEHNESVTNAIIKVINEERKGESNEHSLIRDAINSYVELGLDNEDELENDHPHEWNLPVYEHHFEKKFLSETAAFYTHESKAFLNNNRASEYIKYVEECLDEERKRVINPHFETVTSYLDVSTLQKLVKICEVVLIENHLDVFRDEFQNLLNADNYDDLKRMYALVAHKPHILIELKNIFESHILQEGSQVIKKCTKTKAAIDPKIYVQNILAVHNKYSAIALTAFNNDNCFVFALDKAFGKFINSNAVSQAHSASKSPELLANYCDILLSKSSKNLEGKELEDNLNQVMIVFKYIEDKDVFQKFYSKMLAKRFVENTSVSNDAENVMISKLEQNCGSFYTIKMSNMFKEIHEQEDLNNNFKQHLRNTKIPMEIDINIKVLSDWYWPFKCTPNTSFTIPSELENTVQNFNAFYTGRFKGRKLNWLYASKLCKGELVTNCFTKTYTLEANTFQMAVLLQFNDRTSYSVQQLLENTKIKETILIRILKLLLQAKLLTCTDDANCLTTDSRLKLYLGYENEQLHIEINQAFISELKDGQEAVRKQVQIDRKPIIEAAIVRIMKFHRILSHTKLISEVLHELSSRFKPKISMITKCIKKLIKDKYMEIMEGQVDTYRYLA